MAKCCVSSEYLYFYYYYYYYYYYEGRAAQLFGGLWAPPPHNRSKSCFQMEFMQNTMKTMQKNRKGTRNMESASCPRPPVDFQTVDTSNHKITRTQSFLNREHNNQKITRTAGMNRASCTWKFTGLKLLHQQCAIGNVIRLKRMTPNRKLQLANLVTVGNGRLGRMAKRIHRK